MKRITLILLRNKKINCCFITLFLLLIFTEILFPQTPPQWIDYTEQIEHNNIYSIAIDSNNIKWFATLNGLFKFDGHNWFHYDTTNSGLPANYIKAIKFDRNNILWIGTYQKGLVKYDGFNWVIYDTINSGLAQNIVNEIDVDNSNNIWLTSPNKGLTKFDNTSWTVFNTTNSGIQSNRLVHIKINDNINWIGTGIEGMIKYNDTNWVLYNTTNSGIPDNWIDCIFIDSLKNVWVGTFWGGVGMLNVSSNLWTVYNTIFPGLPSNEIFSVFVESNGIKWFGMANGLSKYNDTIVTVYFSGAAILSIIQDKYKNIWFGMGGNLWVYNPNGVVGIRNQQNEIPTSYKLYQNYPNPFNPTTVIRFQIKDARFVTIKLFDIIGKEIATLVNEKQHPGTYEISFSGDYLSTGVYFYSLFLDGKLFETKKMHLVK